MTSLTIQGVQLRRKQILVALAVLIGAALLFVRSYWVEDGVAHEAIENSGLFLVFVCVLGRTWSTLYIGGRKKTELVRSGPYSISRNPLYVFSFIGVAGLGAMSGSMMLALALLIPTYLVFRWVVAREETHLLGALGEPYAAYLRQVPRFLPRPSLWRDVEKIEITPRLVMRTAIEASLFFIAYPLFEGIETLQAGGFVATPVVLP